MMNRVMHIICPETTTPSDDNKDTRLYMHASCGTPLSKQTLQ